MSEGMSPGQACAIWAAVVYGVTMPVMFLLWPRHKSAATAMTLLPCLSTVPVFWALPGPTAVLCGMLSAAILIRALDARVSFEGSRLRYVLFCHWLVTHPSEDYAPDSGARRAFRFFRGVALWAAVVVLWRWNRGELLWQEWPYLDSALAALELFLGAAGFVDLITVVVHTAGGRFHWVNAIDPRGLWTRSLRAFWSRDWNRTVGGSLRRGIYRPLGGHRRMVRGVLAAFFVSGLAHGAPLILYSPDRWASFLIFAGTMLFFLSHGAMVLLEGALPGHRLTGRVFLYGTWALTLPLYPPLVMIVLGTHGRPLESYLLLRWFG